MFSLDLLSISAKTLILSVPGDNMPLRHILLALLLVTVWGCNFIFIEFSLREMSPVFLCAARFLLAFFPLIFFFKRPKAPFKLVISYGLLIFALQFTLLFMGMKAGMPPGLASLLLQVQVFFSIFFGAVFLRELPNRFQIFGACIASSGILVVASHLNASMTWAGFLFIIAAAGSWGLGNLIAKRMGNRINMMSLVVWGSFIAAFPLTILTFWLEGPSSINYTLHHVSVLGILSLLYIVYASTWFGYGVWNWLLSRYSIATVVPFTLLVPVVGMISSALVFKENLANWEIMAGILVLLGLTINLYGPNLFRICFNKFAENKSTG